jgi:hypothetical protein
VEQELPTLPEHQGYSMGFRGVRVAQSLVYRVQNIGCLRFIYYHWVDTSTRELLLLEGVICPVISVSALTW